MMIHIEQALYDYLSPTAQKEVDAYLALEDEAIELMTREEPILDEDEDGTPGERLARDAYDNRELDEDALTDEARELRHDRKTAR